MVNKKQEFWKALVLLCVGLGIGITAYAYQQALNVRQARASLENDLPVAYANYTIYSSVPGEFFVRMKFMIPCTDEEQANMLNRNMAHVKDYIFTNISSDTEIGDSLRQMKWHRLKELLLEAINDHSNNPVDTIYFQEALVLKSP